MHVRSVAPQVLKRASPGAWMVMLWLAVTLYATAPHVLQASGVPYPTGNRISLALAVVLVLVAGRSSRRPLPSFTLLLLGTFSSVMAMAVRDIPLIQYLVVDVALCYIAATRPRRTSLAAGGMALGVLIGYAAFRALTHLEWGSSTTAAAALTTAIAWLVGDSIHQSRRHGEELQARAAAEAVTAERLRIARELHDMVAHTISIVTLQAGAASRVIDTQPVRARAALREVEVAGRETLTGLHLMLGALRDTATADSGRPAAPMPGLADIERLAEATTAAGVRVDVRWLGERRALPPEIELSAYRIVQEAVTNVVRHAGVRACRVAIAQGPESLEVEVVDAGRGAVPGQAAPSLGAGARRGYGVVGMRERVSLLRGEFIAGPRPEGGYRVAARLPLPTVPAIKTPATADA
jgi:signal transduction histidine kinase